MTFNGMFTLVAVGLRASELSREVFYRFAVVVVILAHAAMHLQFTPTDFFFSLAAALFAALIYQGWRVSRSVPEEVKRATPQFKIATWRRRSIGMWLSSLLDTSSQFLDVIVVGFVIGPTGAAFYFSATRITNVFAMIAGGITNYATGHISKLFHVDAKEELQGVLKSLAIISTLLGVGAFLTIVIFGKFVLSLYGPAYVEMYPALIVLALGTLFTALAGPAPYLLLLTGHERVYPRIMGAGVLLKLGLIAILGPWFGVMGAAIAASTSTALTAIALVAACRRTTKLDPSSATALRGVHRLDGWRTANIKRAA
jgi:O-antigen/teichoic acid export membrane protein